MSSAIDAAAEKSFTSYSSNMDDIFAFKNSLREECSERQLLFEGDVSNSVIETGQNSGHQGHPQSYDSENPLENLNSRLVYNSGSGPRGEGILELSDPTSSLPDQSNSPSNDFAYGNWTVRSSDGFREEVLHEDFCIEEIAEPALFEPKHTDEMTPCSILVAPETGEDSIMVHMMISLPNETDANINLWQQLKTSLVVTQSVKEQELSLPISRDSFLCYQESMDIAVSEQKQAREISARITINNYLQHVQTMYLFQLFLSITEDTSSMGGLSFNWDQMDIITFIQMPCTGQILRPIERLISRQESLSTSNEGVFVCSFTFQDKAIFYHSPSEAVLRERAARTFNVGTISDSDPEREEVVIAERNDIILEANGARAGRPSHRETGQLLMTRAQVEKTIEIRIRWQGLSPRQRRDNVNNGDFYTFLTLNRDETAQCLGVCATWLKDAIRAQGVNVWPGRPLRRTGAMLQTLKENIESARAALKFSDPAIGESHRYEEDIRRYENEVRDVLTMRLEIVKTNVSEEYFNRFLLENGQLYLNPDWNALPPNSLPRHTKS